MSQTGINGSNRHSLRAVAVVLVAVGLAVVGGVGWQWIGKARHVSAQQTRLDRVLDDDWAARRVAGGGPLDRGASAAGPTGQGAAGDGVAADGAAADRAAADGAETAGGPAAARPGPAGRVPIGPPAPGTPIARLHLPTIGVRLVVVEGAADAQLKLGPGRLAGTAELGQPGNAALAAHRYPRVFWDLDQLAVGDPVVVELVDEWLIYRTMRTVIVEPADETVLSPPAPATPSILTLITCEPKLSTAQRLIKQATLVRSQPLAGGTPRELDAPAHR